MSSKKYFPEKDPQAIIPLTFRFANGLDVGEYLITPIVVTIGGGLDASGAVLDATPANIANGPAQIDATKTKVYVPVKGGVDLASYSVKVTVATSNVYKVLVMTGILPIREGA